MPFIAIVAFAILQSFLMTIATKQEGTRNAGAVHGFLMGLASASAGLSFVSIGLAAKAQDDLLEALFPFWAVGGAVASAMAVGLSLILSKRFPIEQDRLQWKLSFVVFVASMATLWACSMSPRLNWI